MAGFRSFGFRTVRVRWAAKFFVCGAVLAGGWSGVPVASQEAPIETLHVYTDTIQIPVLVLSPAREALPPIAPERFNVAIDGGPKFQVKHARVEGDDPISLSILLDVSGDEAPLMSKLSGVVAGLAPLSLRPQDRISIYALDCKLIRSLHDVPADRARLQVGVAEALAAWIDRSKSDRRAACKQAVHLWDALALVVKQMSQLPGRRVILAMTSGVDKGSSNNWNRVRLFAQAEGVAIFGLSAATDAPMPLDFSRLNAENPFIFLCELTGGMVLTATPKTVAHELERFTSIVRGRYIVEFPRPYNGTSGAHDLLVTVSKSDSFVRSAGISVPIVDPAVLADPTTVPSDPSIAPEAGKHRILTTPH
jgi:hypothetical protein